MIDLTERMLLLRQVPIGERLDQATLRATAAMLHEEMYSPGTVIQPQGEAVNAVCIFAKGEVELRRDGRIVGTLHAPQTFGFLDILAQEPASYAATALTDTRAFLLDGESLLELLEDRFDLLVATIRYFAERIRGDLSQLPAGDLQASPTTAVQRPLDRIERILFLRSVTAFAEASIGALSVMAEGVLEQTLPAGSILWPAGAHADRVFFVLRGSVRCEAPDGRVFRFGPRAAVGDTEAIARGTRWYTAVAETDITGYSAPTDRLLDLFEHEGRTAMRFVGALARTQVMTLERRLALGHDALSAPPGELRFGA